MRGDERRFAIPVKLTLYSWIAMGREGKRLGIHAPSSVCLPRGGVGAHVDRVEDDFVTYGFPFVDTLSGGSVRGMIAAVDKVVAFLPSDVKVIPGHGHLATLDEVKKVSATLKDIVGIIEAEVKKKKTLDQIKAAKVLAKYDDMGKAFVTTDAFIETVYQEITEKKSPRP
jgi:cyclase